MRASALILCILVTAACSGERAGDGKSKAPPEGQYLAGVAVRRLPAPVGIGITGFGFSGANVKSESPFAEIYPATTKLHTHVDFRAVVVELEGQDARLVLLRTDTIGVSEVIRQRLVERLSARFGPEIEEQLIVAATHTHAGPGRVIDRPLWEFIADEFDPEFFERLVDAAYATVVAAADDLEPAKVGHAVGATSRVNSDRRCQNAENDWHEAHLVRIDKADGTPKTLIVMHPVHPVVLGINSLSLSKDVSGGIESKLEEGFEDPIVVIHFNGAAADVGKAGAAVQEAPAESVAPWPGGYSHIEALGIAARDDLLPTAKALTTFSSGMLDARTVRTRFDGDAIGYAPGEFPYEYGAVYCLPASNDERCFGDEPFDTMLTGCVDFGALSNGPASAPPDRAPLTVARLGGLVIVTTPGEMGVELGREIEAAAKEATGASAVALIGYANEYTGYSLKEDDWFLGGYEASGSLWGPRQGQFLADTISSWVRAWAEDRHAAAPFEDPGPLTPPGTYEFEPRRTTPSIEVGPLSEPAAEVAPGQLVEWTFGAGDPWLGAPLVHLEQDLGAGVFEPVVTTAGVRWTSDGYSISLELVPEPAYRNKAATERTFQWTARLPVGRRYGGGPPLTQGASYRLAVSAPYHDADGQLQTLQSNSGLFTIQ